MDAAKQIASRMIEELPDEMIPNVISYIAFVKSGNADKVIKDMMNDDSLSSQTPGILLDGVIPKDPSKPIMPRKDVFGCMRGKICISDDFDDPIEDFKEYM